MATSFKTLQQLLPKHVSKVKGNKSENELLGLHQDKKLLHSKGDKTKKQPTEWEKIFAKDISEKELISKIYKELLKLNTHETDNYVKKCAEDMDTSPKKTYKWLTDT